MLMFLAGWMNGEMDQCVVESREGRVRKSFERGNAASLMRHPPDSTTSSLPPQHSSTLNTAMKTQINRCEIDLLATAVQIEMQHIRPLSCSLGIQPRSKNKAT